MNSSKIKSASVSMALGLLVVLVGSAQTASAQTSADGPPLVGPADIIRTDTANDMPLKPEKVGGQSAVSPNAVSNFCTYRFHGTGVIECPTAGIHGDSRVFVSVSEFGPSVTGRFIGAARMTVHNVRPHEGGVSVWVDVDWPSDLNVRVDIWSVP